MSYSQTDRRLIEDAHGKAAQLSTNSSRARGLVGLGEICYLLPATCYLLPTGVSATACCCLLSLLLPASCCFLLLYHYLLLLTTTYSSQSPSLAYSELSEWSQLLSHTSPENAAGPLGGGAGGGGDMVHGVHPAPGKAEEGDAVPHWAGAKT